MRLSFEFGGPRGTITCKYHIHIDGQKCCVGMPLRSGNATCWLAFVDETLVGTLDMLQSVFLHGLNWVGRHFRSHIRGFRRTRRGFRSMIGGFRSMTGGFRRSMCGSSSAAGGQEALLFVGDSAHSPPGAASGNA